MAHTFVGCTDGSELSIAALAAGLSMLDLADARIVVVSVVEAVDPMLVTGTGIAGGLMSAEEFATTQEQEMLEGEGALAAAAASLGRNVETRVLTGDAGPTICDFADEVEATAIVLGSRGRSGFKRAMLGSVSDYVIRNASCPVLVTGAEADEAQ